MTSFESLLDVSWAVQYVPDEPCRDSGLQTLLISSSRSRHADQSSRLSNQCFRYLQSRSRAEPKDDLNDETDRTGPLRECLISRIPSSTDDWPLGLLIESRYQRATFQVVLLTRGRFEAGKCPVVAILYKASLTNLKYVKNWLNEELFLPFSSPLELLPTTLAQICSKYLLSLTTFQESSAGNPDAMGVATVKQVIGNLKLTITFSSAGESIAPELRTIELDLPAETVNMLLKTAQREASASVEHAFLNELAHAIHEKTGLRLPLSGSPNANGGEGTSSSRPYINENERDGMLREPPMKVSKITCAAFAISTDGRIKLASKPIDMAEAIGYSKDMVAEAHLQCLRAICTEAESKTS